MLPKPRSNPPRFLTREADLEEAVKSWAQSPMIAVDTEFVRERTFYPQLALLQISDGRLTGLIDPLSLRELGPLVELIEADSVTKVFHSASEDIETLYHHFGTVPKPIFDTQVAAAFCGFGLGMGYQSLVEEVLGTKLHKGETRSDWLARPLSPAQVSYAAEDVEPLYELGHALKTRLQELDRLDWAQEESQVLLDIHRFDADLEGAFRRIPGHSKLAPRQLEALRRLAAWREGEARRRDLPRNFVVRSKVLLRVAHELPQTMEALANIEGVGKQSLKRYGAIWIELLQQARDLPGARLPRRPVSVSPQRRKQIENSLRQAVAQTAAELDLPVPLLASRRMIEDLATKVLREHTHLPPPFNGWRREAFGELLISKLRAAGVRLLQS